jgi:hypothetical protein
MDSKSDKLTRDPTPENEACEEKKRERAESIRIRISSLTMRNRSLRKRGENNEDQDLP